MNDSYVLVNDELLPASQSTVGVADLALQRGYGVFDFFRCIGGKPTFLNDHLDRLYRSAATLHLPLPENRGEIVEKLMRVINKNGYAESGVRIFVTGGYSPDGYNIAKPNIIVVEGPLKHDAALTAQRHLDDHSRAPAAASAGEDDRLSDGHLSPADAEIARSG